MSDNTREGEQQQQMQEISICDDVWLEIFALISPLELGHLMALISDRFDALVDVHFKSRKWSLGSMAICNATDGNGAQITKYPSGRLPIPQGPMPGKLIGFEYIWISYVDQTVIEFLQRIRRLFDSTGTNVEIHTFVSHRRSWEIIWQMIWPLINDNICRLLLSYSDQLDRLRQFSPAILRNCAKLRLIDSIEHFPDFPAQDNADASSSQAMAKWLLTPRGDGLPKMLLSWFYSERMEGLKRSFVSASAPVNFIVRLLSYSLGREPFELTNNWTGERLTFRRFDKCYWLLVRCPIVREEDKWTNWEKEVIAWQWRRQWNCVHINVNGLHIGDDLVDAKAGPSEAKK
uniref:F-box domain-containing protein n=1 Tax=Globodera rostochiensis TaxID=31243 RepID=A0A914IBC9_GLORO